MDSPTSLLTEINLVKIGFQYLVLSGVLFKQWCHERFFDLPRQRPLVGQKKIFDQLLGNGTPALNNFTGLQVSQHRSGNGGG